MTRSELQGLFVQILLLAKMAGVLKMGNLSLDGSKLHADASKSHAVSYKRLLEIETQLKEEVAELFKLGEQADQGEIQLSEGFVVQDEVTLRQERLLKLAERKRYWNSAPKNGMKANKKNTTTSCVNAK